MSSISDSDFLAGAEDDNIMYGESDSEFVPSHQPESEEPEHDLAHLWQEMESQVVPPDYPIEDHNISSSPPTSSKGDHGTEVSPIATTHRSASAVVDETQFGQIELETQQDSLISRIGETQFANIEPETQTLDPGDGRVFSSAQRDPLVTTSVRDPPAAPLGVNLSFLQRPKESIEDAQEGFKFGHHQKPVSGQFSRPIGRSNGGGASQPDPLRPSTIILARELRTDCPPPHNINQQNAETAETKTISTIDLRAREISYRNQAPHASTDLLPTRYAAEHTRSHPSTGLPRQRSQEPAIVPATASNSLTPANASRATTSSSQARKHIGNANIGHNSEQTHYQAAADPPHVGGERLDELEQVSCKGASGDIRQRGHINPHKSVRDTISTSVRGTENAPLYHQSSQQLAAPRRSPSTSKIAQQPFNNRSSNGINKPLREASFKPNQSRLRRLKSRPPLEDTTNGRSTAAAQSSTQPLQNHKITPFPAVIKGRTNSHCFKPSNKEKSVSTSNEPFKLNIENGESIVPTTRIPKPACEQVEQEPLEERITHSALKNGYLPLGGSVNEDISQQVVDILPEALETAKGGTTSIATCIPHEVPGSQGHLFQPKNDEFTQGYNSIINAELPEISDYTKPVYPTALPQNPSELLREDSPVSCRESPRPVSQNISRPVSRNISRGTPRAGFQRSCRSRSQPRQPISTSPQTPRIHDGKIHKSKNSLASTSTSLFRDAIDALGARLHERRSHNDSDLEFWSKIRDANKRDRDMIAQQKLEIDKLIGERLSDEKLRKVLEDKIATVNKENEVYHKQISALKKKSHQYSTHMNLALKDRDRLAKIGEEREEKTRLAIEGCEAARKIGAAQIQLVKEQEDKRALLEKRVKEVIRYSSENLQTLNTQNKSLTATIELLKKDLERQMVELGRERNLSKMLHDQLVGRKADHQELVGLLTKAQTETVKELTKEDGVLMNILNTGRHVQPKVDELLSLLESLKSTEPGLPAAVVKLLEDSFSRLNDKIPSLEVTSASRASQAKLLGDLKAGLDQLRLDNEERARLKDSITELQAAKATLEGNIATRESELGALKARLEVVDTDLASRSNELDEKKRELEAALARPQEDPHLNAQLQELQRANKSLRDQLDAANRDVSQVKDELRLLQETSKVAQEQLKDAGGKLGEANSKIRKLAEDRKQYTETNNKKHEKEIQELAKSAKSQKDEAQKRYDAMVKTANQQRADLELQLTATRKSLKKNQAELSKLESYGVIVDNLRSEISSCRQQLSQQTRDIIYLEEQCTIRAVRDKEIEISRQVLRDESKELKRLIDDCNSTAAHNFEQGQRERRQIEDELRHVELLKKEKDEIEQNAMAIQERLDFMNNTVADYLKTDGTLREGQTVEQWTATLPKPPPPKRKASQSNGNEEETARSLRSSHFNKLASRSAAPASLGQSQKRHKKGKPDLSTPQLLATILPHAIQDQIASPQESLHRVAKPRGGSRTKPQEPDQAILRTETETSYHSRTTTYQEARKTIQSEGMNAITPIASTALEQSEFSRGEAAPQKGLGRSLDGESTRRKSGTTAKSSTFRTSGVADSQEGDDNMTTITSQAHSARNGEEARQRSQPVPKKSSLKLQHDPSKTPKKTGFSVPLTKSPAHPKVNECSSLQDTTQASSGSIVHGRNSSYNGAKFSSKTGWSSPKTQDQLVEERQLSTQRKEDSPFLGKRNLHRSKSNSGAGRMHSQSKRRVSKQSISQHGNRHRISRTEIPDSQENPLR